MSIIYDFRVGQSSEEEPPWPRATLPNGYRPMRFVWCAQVGKEVFSAKCQCYFASSHFFKDQTICPPSPDGRTFRDYHD
jgi:hypothetical protein